MLQDSASCYIFLLEPNDTLIVIEMFDTASLKYFAKSCVYIIQTVIRFVNGHRKEMLIFMQKVKANL